MTASNLPAALAFILEDEGPELNIGGSEPGGGSKYGVSMVNLIDWNAARGLPKPALDDLAKMTPDFANEIYTETFAKPLRFDVLPTGFDYQLLNISVNLGLHGGGRLAQAVLGVWQGDGSIDDATVAAAKALDPRSAVMMLGAAWIAVKRQSPNWGSSTITPHGYGHGWSNRYLKANARALAMIGAQS